MSYFNFYTESKLPEFNLNNKVLHVPRNIEDKKTLFEVFAHGLTLLSYFGNNWDALDDCLMDLNFISEKTIIIFHEDIPFKNNEKESRIYLETLFDAVRHWWEYPDHKFYVYFPESCKEDVTRIVDSRTYE